MLYGEIIAVCSQIHTKHSNTLCGQNVELFSTTQRHTTPTQCYVMTPQMCTNPSIMCVCSVI